MRSAVMQKSPRRGSGRWWRGRQHSYTTRPGVNGMWHPCGRGVIQVQARSKHLGVGKGRDPLWVKRDGLFPMLLHRKASLDSCLCSLKLGGFVENDAVPAADATHQALEAKKASCGVGRRGYLVSCWLPWCGKSRKSVQLLSPLVSRRALLTPLGRQGTLDDLECLLHHLLALFCILAYWRLLCHIINRPAAKRPQPTCSQGSKPSHH